MDNKAAKLLVKNVFNKILSAKSVNDLESIVNTNPTLKKYEFNTSLYPNLEINISASDIVKLKEQNILSNDNKLVPLSASESRTPLEKLLYSVLWKNGDIGKEKHIVEGVLAAGEVQQDSSKKSGFVFHQYGKHLANREEPIVDQHTIRAFLLFQNISSEDSLITQIRKESKLKPKDLADFKSWLLSSKVGGVEAQFYIDKILFSLGKAIKVTQKSSSKA